MNTTLWGGRGFNRGQFDSGFDRGRGRRDGGGFDASAYDRPPHEEEPEMEEENEPERPANEPEPIEEEDLEADQMAAMGLPTSMGAPPSQEESSKAEVQQKTNRIFKGVKSDSGDWNKT